MSSENDHDFEKRLRGYTRREPQFLRRSDAQITQPIQQATTFLSSYSQELVAPATKKRLHLPSWRGLLALSSAIFLFVVSVGLAGRSLSKSGANQLNAQTLAATKVETARETVSSQLDPNAPQTLKIDKLSLNLQLIQIDNGGQVKAPANKKQIGWLSTSAKPVDSKGVVVLTGYASGEGPFVDLKKLQIGDPVELLQSDAKSSAYEVVATRVYAVKDMDTAKVMSAFDDASGLNLVAFSDENGETTCLVVFATRP